MDPGDVLPHTDAERDKAPAFHRRQVAEESTRRTCPDSGACHHDCESSCWRVATCEPLSASGWPDEVKAANPPSARFENVLIQGGLQD